MPQSLARHLLSLPLDFCFSSLVVFFKAHALPPGPMCFPTPLMKECWSQTGHLFKSPLVTHVLNYPASGLGGCHIIFAAFGNSTSISTQGVNPGWLTGFCCMNPNTLTHFRGLAFLGLDIEIVENFYISIGAANNFYPFKDLTSYIFTQQFSRLIIDQS